MYIDKLDDIVHNYNLYHSKIKMKPVGVMSSTYFDFGIKSNEKDSKFKVGNYLRISKHNIFAKGYVPNWSEEVL